MVVQRYGIAFLKGDRGEMGRLDTVPAPHWICRRQARSSMALLSLWPWPVMRPVLRDWLMIWNAVFRKIRP
jgi:hypothetical protein